MCVKAFARLHTVMKIGDTSKALVIADLIRKLSASKVINNKWRVLYLLDAVAASPSVAPGVVPVRPLVPLPSVYHAPVQATAQPPVVRVGASDALAPADFARNEAGALSRYVTDVLGPANSLSEAQLLRDVIFAFQGIDGSYIHFDPDAGGYSIDARHRVSRGVRDTCRRLCELGWLFRRLRAFLTKWQRHESLGLFGQAFCSLLHDELGDYFRLLAVLEAKILSDDDRRYGDQPGPLVPGTTEQRVAAGLTLRRLLVWIQEPLQRLKLLAMLADAVQGLKGGELISSLVRFSHHGDASVARLVAHALRRVCTPFLEMTWRWMFDGELADPHQEFFVACDASVPVERMWRAMYTMRPAMVPSFLSGELASELFTIGKTINFMRTCCGDTDWTFEPSLRARAAALTYGEAGALAEVVGLASQAANARMRELLFGRFKLSEHLLTLRRYILLGQGDFASYLLDLLRSELDKPANQVFRHNLIGILETALKSTTPISDPDLADRLDVRLLEASPGDTGWEVFSLDYRVDQPIQTILTPGVMSKYVRLFSFVWRLKRAEAHLSHTWSKHATAEHSLRSLPEIRPVVARCHILRNEMAHFIQNLQHYVLFEVEETFQRLSTGLASAANMDACMAAHETFVDDTLDRVLLSGRTEELLAVIGKILVLISRFRQTQDVFFAAALEEVARRQQLARLAYERQLEGKWGVTDRDTAGLTDEQLAFRLTPEAREQLQAFDAKYKTLMGQLLGLLANQSAASLRNLSFRLDFNEYYVSRKR